MGVTDGCVLSMPLLTEKQVGLKPLVVLVGPTAAGKSRVAVEIAKRFDTEVLAADSRQVYRGMDIGTDKPPVAERQGIPHRLLDLVEPDQPFNAGLYCLHASEAIGRLHGEHRLPLVVGGTGLYVRTLLRGLCAAPPADPTVRARLRQEARDEGTDRLYARLAQADPSSASKLHHRDTSKVIRALEVYELTGRSLTAFQDEHGFAGRAYRALLIGLLRDRDELYRRIEERIDWQLANGFVEETQRLLDLGYERDCSAMKGLGYRQVAAFLSGDYDRDEMVRRFKRDTRRFAKRQLTWFRREPDIYWLSINERELIERTAERVTELIDRFLVALEDREGSAGSPSDHAP
jgi:tRNA dimethylallyltransferase